MQMHVARHAMLFVLEVVVLEIGEGVAHVRLAGEKWLLPQHGAVTADAAHAFEMRGQRAGVQHRAHAALAQFRMRQQ